MKLKLLVALALVVGVGFYFYTSKSIDGIPKKEIGRVYPEKNPDRLNPELQRRFELAKAAAAKEGVKLYIQSGYRSYELQTQLFSNAIAKYGSADEASKWVSPPSVSRHPQGIAIDVNYPADPIGAKWLEINGNKFGLCRVFENEWWHFEPNIRPGESCPPRYADAMAREALNIGDW